MRLYQAAAELRVEGIVAKRADSPYGRGRTSDWIRTPAGMDAQAVRAKWKELPGHQARGDAFFCGGA